MALRRNGPANVHASMGEGSGDDDDMDAVVGEGMDGGGALERARLEDDLGPHLGQFGGGQGGPQLGVEAMLDGGKTAGGETLGLLLAERGIVGRAGGAGGKETEQRRGTGGAARGKRPLFA